MREISNNDVRFFWKYTGNKIRYGFYLWISNQIMFDWIFLGKNSAILSYIFLVILCFPIFAYRWRRQQHKKLCLLYWELYLFFSTFVSVKKLGLKFYNQVLSNIWLIEPSVKRPEEHKKSIYNLHFALCQIHFQYLVPIYSCCIRHKKIIQFQLSPI